MIRIAAVADLHCRGGCEGQYRRWFRRVNEHADLLIIAGDFTGSGTAKEAADLAADMSDIRIPMFGVLGNHDWHSSDVKSVVAALESGGITILDGQVATIEVRGQSVGIVGTKGFGGGFGRGLLTPFGEPLVKAWAEEAAAEAGKIERQLSQLDTDYKIVVIHYAPIQETVLGELPDIMPFLGCSRLADVIDRCGADLVIHGHAHKGTERGSTPTGIPVRNVAMQVLQRYYAIYELRPIDETTTVPAAKLHSR